MAAAAAQQFASYEADFNVALRSVQNNLKHMNALQGERRKLVVRDAERSLDDATRLLSSMEALARRNVTANLQPRVTTHQSSLARVRRDVERAVRNTGRSELMAGAGGADAWAQRHADQRSRLLRDQQRVNETTDRITDTQRVAEQSERIGEGILNDLGDQREALLRADQRLHNVDANVSKSRKLLRAMELRIVQNKLLLVGIIVVLLLANIGVLYMWLIYPWPFNGAGAPPFATPAPTHTPTVAPTPQPSPPAPGAAT